MERRIGIITVLVFNTKHINELNSLLSSYSDLILARLGLPLKDKKVNLITLVIELNTDDLGALTGKIGKISGVKVKSMLTEFKFEHGV